MTTKVEKRQENLRILRDCVISAGIPPMLATVLKIIFTK